MPTIHDDDVRFARWLANLGGWAHTSNLTGDSPYAAVADRWFADGRAEIAVRDGHGKAVQFTAAGQAWHHENGGD